MKVVLGLLSTVLLYAVALGQDQPPPANPPQIGFKAKAVLAENEKKMIGLKTYSADCWTTTIGDDGKKEYEMATLTVAKPNFIRYDVWDMERDTNGKLVKKQVMPKSTLACDGETVYRQDGKVCKFRKYTDPEELYTWLEPWIGFHTTNHSLRAYFARNETQSTQESLRYVGQETFEQTQCDIITFKHHNSITGQTGDTVTEIRSDNEGYLYFGPDKLARRRVTVTMTQISSGEKKLPGRRMTRDAVLRKIQTNFPLPPVSAFAYTLPEGVTLQEDKPLLN